MTFSFIHAADIHLDSPLVNLARYDGAPVEAFRSATRQALDNLVQLAIDEKARFILIAGDLYDGDCNDFNTPRWLRRKMEELKAADIRVFIVQGNHDAQSRMKKAFRLHLPDNVHSFPTNKPEAVPIEELQVVIHGQGFATESILNDLSIAYSPPRRGWINIGLLHTNCGAHEGHDNYAPSTIDSLAAKGYEYWALGHIHKHKILHECDPWIVYPGNIQGRHINEEGRKGCTLVTVEDGRIINVKHRDLDVVRWVRCNVDASGLTDPPAVMTAVCEAIADSLAGAENRMLAVRVEITGSSQAHFELSSYAPHWQEQLRDNVVDRFDERVWVEKAVFRTRAAVDLDALAVRNDSLGELLRGVRDLDAAGEALRDVRGDLDEMLKRLPADPRSPAARVDLDDPEQLLSAFADAKEMLVSRLLQSGGGP